MNHSLLEKIKLSQGQRASIKKYALIIALMIFVGGSYAAIINYPGEISELKLGPMLLVLMIGVPIAILLNAFEFVQSAGYKGKHTSYVDALEVTIIASAANMLPLPGGAIARVAALNSLGINVKDGVVINLIIAFIWLGVALIYSGLWLIMENQLSYAMLFVGMGICICITVLFFLFKKTGFTKHIVFISIAKVVMLMIDSARVMLCFWAIGEVATFSQSSVLAVSGVLGSAVSIVPAGLGIREVIASGLSSVVGLSLASGFLSVAVNRITGMMAIVPIGFYLISRKNSQE